MKMFYKFTEKGGVTYGGYKWPLPTKNKDGTWTAGKWTRKIKGNLEACENGYHFTDPQWCASWIDAEMYEVEIEGDYIPSDTPVKYICRRARLIRKIEAWDEKSARLFAVRCARDAMKLIDPKKRDHRSINAIDVAERFANGEATEQQLDAARAAARDAAWDAARAAARDAAWAAARAAARDAARAAARDAAWDAARAAARDAAWAAARDAARAAARAAARDAAWAAAWAAARDAARAAARAAARDAAWAAARDAALQKYSGWLLEAVGEKPVENHAASSEEATNAAHNS